MSTNIEKNESMNKCDKYPYLVDVFGNFVQCIKTGRFVNYEYWNNIRPKDCPRDQTDIKKERK